MSARAALLAVALCVLAGCGSSDRAGPNLNGNDPRVLAGFAHRAQEARGLGGAPAPATTPAVATTAGSTQATPAPLPPGSAPPAARPPIVVRLIPFGPTRREEMRRYAERHYGIATARLVHPHVIVEHLTETPTFQAAYAIFAPDVPDAELHELPGTCAHFVVDRDGTIYELVRTTLMCRHTVGLNWTAIGIEHVGSSDGQLLGDPAQLGASLRLTRWLRCHFRIRVRDVIGHNESLSSPYHRERVAALRTQTHDDLHRAAMDVYRRRLAALGACPHA